MKQILAISILSFAPYFACAQIDGPKEITPQVLQQINGAIDKEIPAFKQKLSTQNLTAEQIEFALDTFRIEEMAARRMDVDYSTVGMNISIDEMAAAYDKLLNKYYNKLVKLLSPEDKKTLITAQKTWLAYRDAETTLVWTMAKDEYTGGGTMYSNIATGACADLVVKRVIKIFNYYDGIVKGK